jgi:enolase
MKITKVHAREIFDARGVPTIECQLFLEDDFYVTSSVPAGISTSSYEAKELRDGGTRLQGMGVRKAITVIEDIIAPAIIGKEPDVVVMDQIMVALDDTPDKSKLGANAMLAVSIAVVKAQAALHGFELYEFIAQLCGHESVILPFPLFNMIAGGVHTDNNLLTQEFLIVPMGAKNFREVIEYGVEFFYTLKDLLKKRNYQSLIGIEGGFAPMLENDIQAFDLLTEAIEKMNGSDFFKIAIDVAASHLYDAKTNLYTWYGKTYNSTELISSYQKLVEHYPICSIEDGIQEHDLEGWATLTETLGKKVQIIGDDIFATDPGRIYQGIIKQLATGAIIKPNQIGTITETLQAIAVCQEHGFTTIISHRSGETNDDFIADLAVGTNAGQIKAGGLSRGERLAKYNRLLTIEDELALSLLADE